ncbi:unnamed protein product [Microthlaspi erraticum]|uniref:Uncharacterized protein n=1 Tax=Microthlaspi erraticum TaxID=1685480 RepID=A0A6D2K6M0_9BRAS|nr:unnamed protein product [Microthlaspi erraticum]
MICLRRRNGKSDKHLGIKPVSSTRPRKRTTNGLIPAWVRRQPFQRYVDVLAKPLDNTDLVITRDRAVSSSHEPDKTNRFRRSTIPRKQVLPKRDPNRFRRSTIPRKQVLPKRDPNRFRRSTIPRKQVLPKRDPNRFRRSTIPRKQVLPKRTPTGFVEARSRENSVPKRDPNRSRHHIRNRAVSSSHEPDKTPISSSYTKSSGLVITRARQDTDLVIIYEIERSRHHTSPRRHRSRHHIRDRAVSSSHEPDKTNLVEARIREKSSHQSILLDETKESSRQVREKLSKAHSICGQDYVTVLFSLLMVFIP